jgi:hypothetical protein
MDSCTEAKAAKKSYAPPVVELVSTLVEVTEGLVPDTGAGGS